MLMDLVVGTLGVMGTVSGIAALVLYRKNGNGHMPEPEKKLEIAVLPAKTDSLDMERLFTQYLERQEKGRRDDQERIMKMFRDLLPPPAPAPPAPVVKLPAVEQLVDRVEALLQMGPPVVEIPPVTMSPITMPEIERKLGQLVQQLSRIVTPSPKAKGPDGDDPNFKPLGPVGRFSAPIQLDIFNTVTILENTVYELVPPENDIYHAYIMNLGPGNLYMRANVEPTVNDPFATTLPPGTGDNEIHTPEHFYVIADWGGATFSLRLGHA